MVHKTLRSVILISFFFVPLEESWSNQRIGKRDAYGHMSAMHVYYSQNRGTDQGTQYLPSLQMFVVPRSSPRQMPERATTLKLPQDRFVQRPSHFVIQLFVATKTKLLTALLNKLQAKRMGRDGREIQHTRTINLLQNYTR